MGITGRTNIAWSDEDCMEMKIAVRVKTATWKVSGERGQDENCWKNEDTIGRMRIHRHWRENVDCMEIVGRVRTVARGVAGRARTSQELSGEQHCREVLGEQGLRGNCWESEGCMEIVVGVRNVWNSW